MMRRMQARRGLVALPLIALVLACLAPVGAAALTGLATGPDSVDGVETADRKADSDDGDGGARRAGEASDGHLTGAVPMGGAAPSDPSGTDSTAVPPPSTDVTAAAPPSTVATPPSSTAPPTTAAPAPAPTTTTAPPPPAPSPEEVVVALANADRAEAGCPPLRIDGRLARAAQEHSDAMAALDFFSHTSPDGTTASERMEAAGYPQPGGENIAQGQRSAQEVHDAWMGSDGHRRNILDCDFAAVGVGLEPDSWTWTQDFGF
jgi:uncharacterized protein YkwD